MILCAALSQVVMLLNGVGGMQVLLRKNLTKLPQFVTRAPAKI